MFNALQAGFLSGSTINMADPTSHFNIWFFKDVSVNILASNVGITSLNTGVIGGLVVASVVIACFKKWKNVELPSFLSFFSGSRAIPFIVTFFLIEISFITMLIWPLIGIGLNAIGNLVSDAPTGVAAGIVAFIWRTLTPIGLHHAFYTIFWFTSAGGRIDTNTTYIWVNNHYESIATYINNQGGFNAGDKSLWTGDSQIWFMFEKYNIHFNWNFYSDSQGKNLINVHPGQFIGPNFPFMIGGSVGSILAMIKAAPKKERKKVGAIMGSALITSMSIGVTEPWLWSYIVLAPVMFFGFNAIMCGIGAAIMPLLGSHVGTGFSCGLLDWVIYGLIPFQNGTNPEWVIILSIIYMPIYFFAFHFYMKWKKIRFPIIEEGVVLGDKSKTRKQWNIDKLLVDLIKGLGGNNNISSIFNCATRLRCDVINEKLINEKLLMTTGAYKVLVLGKNIQIIYGTNAESISMRANDYLKELKRNENNNQKNIPLNKSKLKDKVKLKTNAKAKSKKTK